VTSAGCSRASLVLSAALFAVTTACGHSRHGHLPSFSPPPVPAGFVEHTGAGWRIAVPSTWGASTQKGPTLWAVTDPQGVDQFHANANVVTEPFSGESYDYAKANEAALRRERRAAVDASRESVVDGDPTLLIESRWVPSPPATVGYRTLQSALSSHGAGYVVTCSVASSAFERYRSTCESIVGSFAVER
jgi:hypothetical protein